MINSAVLVLNKSYQPLHVTTVKRAFCLLYQGMAKAVDENYQLFDFDSWSTLSVAVHDDSINTVNRAIRIPRVVLLTTCARPPRKIVRFNRHNIYLRDKNTCQYCGKTSSKSELNLDHVIPRTQGGKTNWKNIVCSCYPCNLRKGGRTPREAKMLLLNKPKRPKWSPLFGFPGKTQYREWFPYLKLIDATYWHLELEKD
jgi:5-methylcytosine-specific restriction endonuclease McrA